MGPNILIVLADQFRADCVGVAGHPDIRTPALDCLAQDGVYYSNSFCVAPLCTPSRYSLLTGHLPAEHGVHTNNLPLVRRLPTLPERARGLGVRSSAVGKMHFNPTYMDTGFATMRLCEQNGDGRLVDDYHADLLDAGLVDVVDLVDQRADYRRRATARYWDSFGACVSDLPGRWHSTSWTADTAISLMHEGWSQGGQLMYLSFVKPHHPFDPPEPWHQAYDPDDLTVLPGWTSQVPDQDTRAGFFNNKSLTEADLRRIMALYYGSISHLDFHLARVLRHLRSIDAYDNTMIIFTSDHGEYLGFHHMILKTGPMYDPVIRVPLIIKPDVSGDVQTWPSRGYCDERLVSGADIVPTALAALGLTAPELSGHDLADPTWIRDVVVAQSGDSNYMARSRTAKLLRQGDQSLFFDLQGDPWELHPSVDLPNPSEQRQLEREVETVSTMITRNQTSDSRGTDPQAPRRGTDTQHERSRRFDELASAANHPWLT